MRANKGVVNIRGKEYQTVALRVALFRENHPSYSIITKIENIDEKTVVVSAQVVSDKNIIISTGHAEEVRNSSNINKTSALENAESSAVGRALAFFGLQGEEFNIASADEMTNALVAQDKTPKGTSKGGLKPLGMKGDLSPVIEFDCKSKGKTINSLTHTQAQDMYNWIMDNNVKKKDLYIEALRNKLGVMTTDDIPF